MSVRDTTDATISGSELFANVGMGVSRSDSAQVDALGNWWGAADGPSGVGPGTGDGITEGIDIGGLMGDDILTTGTAFSYSNAGGDSGFNVGTLPSPTVVQGESTQEWGNEAWRSALYDADKVILDYTGLEADARYELITMHYNGDDTSASGGNIQTIEDNQTQEIMPSLVIADQPLAIKASLSLAQVLDGSLRLNINRENGLRSTVSQVWLLENTDTDISAPELTLASPVHNSTYRQQTISVQGRFNDTQSGVSRLEVCISTNGREQWFVVNDLALSGSWHYNWVPLEDGVYSVRARARDNAGNVSLLPTIVTVTIDSQAPTSINSLVVFDTSDDAGESLTLNWQPSPAVDVARYLIERHTTGDSFSAASTVEANISQFVDTGLEAGRAYVYSVIAEDHAGNRSPVVISAAATPIDNNQTDNLAPEDVTDFQGVVSSGLVTLSWAASADTAGDLVGYRLEISQDDGINWGSNVPDFNNGESTALSKGAINYSVQSLINDQSYAFRLKTVDSNHNVSAGVVVSDLTPSATAVIDVGGVLTQDTVWAAGVYQVSNNLTVNAGVTLDIRPGVIVKFTRNRSLNVNGTLLSDGVIFTAFTDDAHGGDSNGDGLSQGTAGYWRSIQVNPNSEGVRLINCKVLYGGSSTGAVYLNSANDVRIQGTEIAHSASTGIYASWNNRLSIEDSHIHDVSTEGLSFYYGSDAVVTGNVIERTQTGVSAQSHSGMQLDNNTVKDNTQWGINVKNNVEMPIIEGNTLINNAYGNALPLSAVPNENNGNMLKPNGLADEGSRLLVRSGARIRDITISSAVADVYQFSSGWSDIRAGVVMTVDPGAVLEFYPGAGLTINGALNAVGTADNKITFTATTDDTVGGDSFGVASAAKPGDWRNITFTDSSIDFVSRLEHVSIRYAGSGNNAAVYLSNAAPDIRFTEIAYSSTSGLYLNGTGTNNAAIEDNTIHHNDKSGIQAHRTSALFKNNYLHNNTEHGLYLGYQSIPTIDGNRIEHNGGLGIETHGSYGGAELPELKRNTVIHNAYPARLSSLGLLNADAPVEEQNVWVPNDINALFLLGGTTRNNKLHLGVRTSGDAELNTYVVQSNVEMQSGSTLSVDPGVRLKFYANTGLTARGAVSLIGTPSQPIELTSVDDDGRGGDVMGDGGAASPYNGIWQGLRLESSATGALEHVNISYGGQGRGSVSVLADSITLKDITTAFSGDHGISLGGDGITATGLQSYANLKDGVELYNRRGASAQSNEIELTELRSYANQGSGVSVRDTTDATISASELFGNINMGVSRSGLAQVDAPGNWWGAADGPAGVGPGTGDGVTEGVDIGGLLGDDILTTGTAFSYSNAGGDSGFNVGTLPSPTVVQGESTQEWGNEAWRSTLYDAEKVILDYTGLDMSSRYELITMHYNGDDTSASGGNVLSVEGSQATEIIPSLHVSGHALAVKASLSSAQAADGSLRLNINRENGLRSTVSQVWLLENTNTDISAPELTLSSPSDNSTYSQQTIAIQGSVNDVQSGVSRLDVGISINGQEQWFTANNLTVSGTWQYNWAPTQDGEYGMRARVRDNAGNVRFLQSAITVTIDSQAPAPVNSLVVFDTVDDSGESLTVNWQLSADVDVAQYIISRSSGAGRFVGINTVDTGINQFIDSGLSVGVSYKYSVTAEDHAGNRSSSVISAAATPIDNNQTDNLAPEDVSDFQGVVSSGLVTLSWVASADTAGDLVGYRLEISQDGGINWGSNVPDFNNGESTTLSKGAINYSVQSLINDQSYAFRLKTVDSNHNVSAGVVVSDLTPSARAVIDVSGVLTQDTVWAAGVYHISNNLTVNAGVTLDIRPGVIVKFTRSRSLNVNGTLLSDGVIFTAFTDDAHGGDSNGDGLSQGSVGYWRSIQVNPNSEGVRLLNSKVLYGGSSTGAVYLNSAYDVRIQGTEIAHSASTGIYAGWSDTLWVKDSHIHDVSTAGLSFYYGSDAVVTGNVIERTQTGVSAQSHSGMQFDNNTVKDNTQWGINVKNSVEMPIIEGNTLINNAYGNALPLSAVPNEDNGNTLKPNGLADEGSRLLVRSGARIRDITISPEVADVYQFSSGWSDIRAGVVMTVEPGAVLKFDPGAGLTINGALNAVGTADNKITFTATTDDTVGGDSFGVASAAKPGDWRNITFTDSSIDFVSRLEHVSIRYAGSGNNAAVYLSNAAPDIRFTEIAYSSTSGLYLNGTGTNNAIIEDNAIHHNDKSGIQAHRTSARLKNNYLHHNAEHGLYLGYQSIPTIDGNRIEHNGGLGIETHASYAGAELPELKRNTVIHNAYPARLSSLGLLNADAPVEEQNVWVPNDINALFLLGGTTRNNKLHLGVKASGDAELNTYVVQSNVEMQSGSTLSVDPGVRLKFYTNTGLTARGAVSLIGTPSQPIELTSVDDDGRGGDVMGDGHAASPYNGIWQGLRLESSAAGALEHVNISYGGQGRGSVSVLADNITLNDITTAFSGDHGISLGGDGITVTGLESYANLKDGVELYNRRGSSATANDITLTNSRSYANQGSGVSVRDTTDATISASELFANVGMGVSRTGTAQVSALDNWWGAADGPSGVGPGTGDGITEGVDITEGSNEEFRTDGTEFILYDSGGDQHKSYGVISPLHTASSSTEFGESVWQTASVSYDKALGFDFTGLSSQASYQLLSVSRAAEQEIYTQAISLGTDTRSVESVTASTLVSETMIPEQSIDNSNLSLIISALQGSRAINTALYLIKKPSEDRTSPSLSIATPMDGQLLATGMVTISGLATDDGLIDRVDVLVAKSLGTEEWRAINSIDSRGNFHYRWSSEESGTYLLKVRAYDESGNLAESQAISFEYDTTIPAKVVGAVAIEDQNGISLLWEPNSASDNVREYIIERALTGSQYALLTDVTGVSYRDETINAGEAYFYRIYAKDAAGNLSEPVQLGPVKLTGFADNDAPANVTGLTASAGHVNQLSAVAFLNWTPSIDADVIEQRLLISSDEGVSFGSNAPTFDNGQYISLSQQSQTTSVKGLALNQPYRLSIKAVDSSGNINQGVSVDLEATGAATETIELFGEIPHGTVLPAAIYEVSANLTVARGSSLSIEDGAILKFHKNKSFSVLGAFSANGVVFTAWTDDDHGGDSNDDGLSQGTPGYWNFINISPQAAPIQLENSRVLYAGASSSYGSLRIATDNNDLNGVISGNEIAYGRYSGVVIANSNRVSFHDNDIHDHGGNGIEVVGGKNSSLQGNTITDVGKHGVYVNNSTGLKLDSNTISNNQEYGVYYTSYKAMASLVDNTIIDNLSGPFVLPINGLVGSSGNTFSPNGRQIAQIRSGGTLQHDFAFSKLHDKDGLNPISLYIVSGIIKTDTTTAVTIDSGLVIKFEANSGLDIYGQLNIQGTENEPVVLTTVSDDLHSGDSNFNGAQTVATNGAWSGITVRKSLVSDFGKIEYANILFAGSTQSSSIWLGASIPVINSVISNSSSNGILIYNASPQITGNRIWGNSHNGIKVEGSSASNPAINFNRISSNEASGVQLIGSVSASLTNNDFHSNRLFAVNNNSSISVNATQSWWGDSDSSGPRNDATNASGTGDAVTDNVDFSSYLETKPFDFAYINFDASGNVSKGSIAAPEILQGTVDNNWGATPGHSAIKDTEKISLKYSGLNSTKRYKVRASYYNGDGGTVERVLSASDGEIIHGKMLTPTGSSVQYEFNIPATYYATGDLTLDFTLDNQDTAARVALSELWLLERQSDLIPTKFESVAFNDRDGNGFVSVGDEYHFRFSDPVGNTQIGSQTTQANSKLPTSTGAIYGAINEVEWHAGGTLLVVTVSDGFTLTGNESVTPDGLLDESGIAVVGTQTLGVLDTVAPVLQNIVWHDTDHSGYLGLNDVYEFIFSESIDNDTLTNASTLANDWLRPLPNKRYGATNTIRWNDNNSSAFVTITDGYTVIGDERVIPSGFLMDVAGNSVTGEGVLSGRDTTAPTITALSFDDADGNAIISMGDSYSFMFSESMRKETISNNTTEANVALNPSGFTYGSINQVEWNAAGTELDVYITEGFSISGDEEVIPVSSLTDINNNPVQGSVFLNTIDVVAPTLVSVTASAENPVGLADEYTLAVQFSSSMQSNIEPSLLFAGTSDVRPQVTGGRWSTTRYPNDTYVTEPIALSYLMTGELLLSVSGGEDLVGNVFADQADVYSLIVQRPAPSIDGLSVAPSINYVTSSTITLQGDRRDTMAILLNGAEIAASGSGAWSALVNLNQSLNQLKISGLDVHGLETEERVVLISVDSIAPSITSISPAANSRHRNAPESIKLGVMEVGSGVDLQQSQLLVLRGGIEFSGQWNKQGSSIVFAPGIAITEGVYNISVNLKDYAGLSSGVFNSSFVIDQTPPVAPSLDSSPEVTNNSHYIFSGGKTSGTAIFINGEKVIEHSSGTTWSHSVALNSGSNELAFTAVDEAGNSSLPSNVSIQFDNTAPGPISINVDGDRDGSSAQITWYDYNESANGGDIKSYHVYVSNTPFTNQANASRLATLSSGQKDTIAKGLIEGNTYHFAVQGEDQQGNTASAMQSLSVVIRDTEAPENVSDLRVQSFAEKLVFSWSPTASGEASQYKVDANGSELLIDATLSSYELTGLSPAAGYRFSIKTLDTNANESDGVSIEAATLLANPANIQLEALSGQIGVLWSESSPAELVKEYAVYVSETDFSSVNGLTPRLRISKGRTAAKVAGLRNQKSYYVAVTTINISDGESQQVSAIEVSPTQDATGPEIHSVHYNGSSINSGSTLRYSADFQVHASDPSGVSRVELAIDGAIIGRALVNGDGYTMRLDLPSYTDGSHDLSIHAYDTLDNRTEFLIVLSFALANPDAPIILTPQDGYTSNESQISVTGTAEKFSSVEIRRSDILGATTTTDATGEFNVLLDLEEGQNLITAIASNRGGTSTPSNSITVTRDTTIPETPLGLIAAVKSGGEVRLNWNKSVDSSVVGYDIYRHMTSFSGLSVASKVNAQAITLTAYTDLPGADGRYYYRVVTRNNQGTLSAPSKEVIVESDSQVPKASQINYTHNGHFDNVSNRMGTGYVDVEVIVTEPLLTTPFLSLTPNGGIPIPVQLRKAGERVYVGSFEITDSTKSGTTYAVFSARDKVGNRGTEIENGATIIIDTDGPQVQQLSITPADPIRNDELNTQQVFVSFTLNDQLKNGTQPQLGYKIADSDISLTSNLVQVSEFGWKGSLQLPPEAGLAEPQLLVFTFSAVDDLDNVSLEILGKNSWQVYQGDLPPLAMPGGFRGASQASGQVQLNWLAVDGASAYEIYRQAPSESGLILLATVTVSDIYIDTTAVVDGDYLYAINSVREDNGERAISALSEPLTVNSDSVAPPAPMNLTLELGSDGIRADWTNSSVEEGISYRLYRSADNDITDVSGLTPVITGIYGAQAHDNNPDENQHAYVVTAVDLAGNESAPSNSAYLNFQLLPISALEVSLSEGQQPVVRWAHPGSTIQGYDIYLGSRSTGSKLNSSSIATTEYIDTGYSNHTRVYTVVAKDTADAQSLGRSIALPLIELEKSPRKTIKRGVMNILSYSVKNAGAEPLKNATLKVTINGRQHQSTAFDLANDKTSAIDVVVGGYSDLADIEDIVLNLKSVPSPGKIINLQFKDTINTVEAGLLLNIKTQNLSQGGTGQLRFTLQNSSPVALDVITANNTGKEPSNEVRIKLTDLDGNVLQVIPYQQSIGSTVTTLADGTSISRMAANSSFESDWIDLDLAVTTPDRINIILEIDHIHYALGEDESVTIKGLKTSREVTTDASPYSASITAISPQTSYGDQNISIEGQALSAGSNRALPDTVVTLVIEVAGFERKAIVRTDTQGNFKYGFEPNEGESGSYTVSAIHPSRTDRPQSGSFVISHVSASPYAIDLKMPRNYEQLIPIKVTAGDGTISTHTRLRVEAIDQLGGELPVGFILDTSESVNLISGQTDTLKLKVTANSQSQDNGEIRLALISDESGLEALQYITINYALSDAVPALFFTPNFVETGVGRNESVTELIELENRGLAAMSNVTLELIDQAGGLAPAWAYLVSPADQGTLAIGEKRNIQIIASPGGNIQEGIYQLALRVTSDNHETQDIGVYVSVTQSGEGSFILKAEDIYTATINEEGQLIQGVDNTRIRIQNESVASIEFTQSTDDSGEVFFQNIPAGRYRFRATAAKHKEYVGRFTVKPGITGSQSIFLDYELITVEWSVSEITLQDKYEIVLNATFETDVPAAVVVAKPLSVTIPDMAVGDVFYGEFELLNHGLVRADEFFFKLPPDDTYFRYEAMRGIPESIPAKGRVTIPYRIIALKSFNAGANDTGAGCGGYGTGGGYGYSYECANGSTSSGGGSTGFNKSGDGGSCGIGGGGSAGFGGSGGSGGGSDSSSPAYGGIGGGDAGCKPDCSSCSCQGSGGGGGY